MAYTYEQFEADINRRGFVPAVKNAMADLLPDTGTTEPTEPTDPGQSGEHRPAKGN